MDHRGWNQGGGARRRLEARWRWWCSRVQGGRCWGSGELRPKRRGRAARGSCWARRTTDAGAGARGAPLLERSGDGALARRRRTGAGDGGGGGHGRRRGGRRPQGTEGRRSWPSRWCCGGRAADAGDEEEAEGTGRGRGAGRAREKEGRGGSGAGSSMRASASEWRRRRMEGEVGLGLGKVGRLGCWDLVGRPG